MKTTILLAFGGLVLSTFAQTATAATVDELVAQGRDALVRQDLIEARDRFASAVARAPGHEAANVLLAGTRLLTLPDHPSVKAFLDYAGFSSTGRSVFRWTAEPTVDTNHLPVLPPGLNSAQAVAIVRNQVLPEIAGALGNLAKVSRADFTLALTAEETSGSEDVVIDYGDVQLARAFLHLAQFLCYTLSVHNLDIYGPHLVDLVKNEALDFQTIFSAYPDLLTFSRPADLLPSKAALLNAIARYRAASALIRARPAGAERLFNLEPGDVEDEAEFRTNVLRNVATSLQQPLRIDDEGGNDATLFIGAYFNGLRSLRSLLPQFDGSSMVAGTLPDPTFGGVLGRISRQEIEDWFRDDDQLTNRTELVRPTVAIVSPGQLAVLNQPTILIQGRAADNAAVARVEYQVNGGPFQVAAGSEVWTATVNLQAGLNVIRARSVDVAGNESLLASRTVRYVASDYLALKMGGDGTGRIVGPTNDSFLVVGRQYLWVALPDPDSLFLEWTGGASGSKPALTATMTSNLTLVATFVKNPFIPVAGVYNGLFFPVEIGPTNSGFITLSLTRSGAFSGRIILMGRSLPFSGKFDPLGYSGVTVPQPGKPRINLFLTLDPERKSLGGPITGSDFNAEVVAVLASAHASAIAPVDRYTFAIVPDPNVAGNNGVATPPGAVVGTGLLRQGRNLTMAGTLADGTPISQVVAITDGGYWPLYAAPYGGRGVVIGWASFETADTGMRIRGGSIRWIKPPLPGHKYYPQGFNQARMLRGHRYVIPAVTAAPLTWSDGFIEVDHGNLPASVRNAVLLQPARVSFPDGNANRFVLTMNRGNGSFTGRFLHPQNASVAPFSAVFLQDIDEAVGWFRGIDECGSLQMFETSPVTELP